MTRNRKKCTDSHRPDLHTLGREGLVSLVLHSLPSFLLYARTPGQRSSSYVAPSVWITLPYGVKVIQHLLFLHFLKTNEKVND